jgi:hypothetical protein
MFAAFRRDQPELFNGPNNAAPSHAIEKQRSGGFKTGVGDKICPMFSKRW